MNKNFINVVRKSLNEPNGEKSKNNGRIIFPSSDYKSESLFANHENVRYKENNKIKQLISFKSKKKKKTKEIKNFDIFCENYCPNVEIISGCSTCLTPSTSEITQVNQEIGIYSNNEDYSEDSDREFEIDEFSNSRDPRNSCESFTETYSDIEEEFTSFISKKIKISTNRLIEDDSCEQREVLHSVNRSNFLTNYRKRKDAHDQKEPNIIFVENQDSGASELQKEIGEVDFKEHSGPFHDQKEPNIIIIENQDSDASELQKEINEVDFKEQLGIVEDNLFPINNENNCKPPNVNAKYFDFEDYIVVILKEQKSIPFYGNFVMKILKGQVQVLGSVLDNSSEPIEMYSPRGYSLLVIKNITCDGEKEMNLRELQNLPHLQEKVLNTIVNKNSAVFLCFKMQNERLNFIQKYTSQQIFPKIHNENLPQVIFEPKDNINSVVEVDDWQHIADLVHISSKIFITGGKGVGKSTFLRYMINKLLNKFEEIRVIDLDPGQAEFYVPGCLSVVNISRPCIGPNFTHINKPERSYLSNISVADPVQYIKSVKSLMNYVSSLPTIPTLINNMGYSKGLGIKIASSLITLVKPTNVIQIESAHKNKNFPCDLNVANIKRNLNYFGGTALDLNYRVHKFSSAAEEFSGWKLEPRQARELCILAYLGEGMTDNHNSLTDHNLPMYEINLSSIKIRDLHNKEISPGVINANIVALCNLDDTYDTFICLGFGVVRGIDVENDYLVLVTQVNPEILDEVSYLVLSSISLQPTVYMMPQNIRGLMPYVMEGELTSLAQLTKRSYLPAVRTSSKD